MNKKKNSNNYLSIDELIDNTFSRIKEVVDANTIIGKTITLPGGKTIIPISKVSVGVVSGGGELPGKKKNNMSITAGSTSGFTITPMGFVVINNELIDFIGVAGSDLSSSRYFDIFAGICEKFLNKKDDSSYES